MMFEFTDEERARLTGTRAIGQDDQGREVLVGLTMEETAFCMDHGRRRPLSTDRDMDGVYKKRYAELMEKHERALK